MRVTLNYIRNLLREATGDDSCPAATQDTKLNAQNKAKAAKNPKIKYGYPEKVPELKTLAEKGSLCGNCAAFNVSKKMIKCGAATEDGARGYCMMHEFTCAAEKTCLTWAPGGPKTS